MPVLYPPSDYDTHGNLKTPLLFWCTLLLQARTWFVLVLAAASRQQGDAILGVFYPDRDNFWFGLLPGVPAALAFMISGRRHLYPRVWAAVRWVLIAAQLVLLTWQLLLLWQGEDLTGVTLLLLLADLFALWWLATSRRLRDYFIINRE
ncbi:DUF2919 domain-containing protein [Buttiauxella noackiae]|jgi:hypothetical protein|uniref:Inner membrane protein n=1 Tax=Buttiauxella noackiae ATCC 51607 TaxID=1354255 RepID=A0A1B7HNJ4_9ENTR|nr:DUF2919 domain-containing protein [Buttiauxella noackiae]MCA1922538.1 DUF2919 domain-containing protein [Buttiauxella noackiae]OAT17204.1 inner membrane protein [Buttiauxella noackiae ATCC 51607]